ncbi:MAG: metal-dependent transcriptional regulator [Candidatus Methanomethylophilaceae archaeon]|nr:metal-dependent transcriptional regulator [Candidatus Methanomethylophilaceae archaeon]
MQTGNREDYLINILRLSEEGGVVKTSKLAAIMDVSPASVTEMVRVLKEAGFVNYKKYQGVTLTEEGLAYARNLRRKHHIMERFLTDVLDVDHESAHEEACRMEHSISDDSVNKICRIIGTKKDCDCDACNNPCDKEVKVSLLSDLKDGESGIISHLKCDDVQDLKQLIAIGFVPGREIIMKSVTDETVIVEISGEYVAISSDLTSRVYLEE